MTERRIVEPSEEGCFESQMVYHTRKQTAFLEAIYDTLQAVRTIARFLTWAVGFIAGGFGMWEFIKTNFKQGG